MEPLRQIPGFKRPARTWQDEVRERVARRKQQREEMRVVTPALEQQPELSQDEVEAAVASLDFCGERPDVDEARERAATAPLIESAVEPEPVREPDEAATTPASAVASERDELDALDRLVGSVAIDRQNPPYDALEEDRGDRGRARGGRGHEAGAGALDQLSLRPAMRSFNPTSREAVAVPSEPTPEDVAAEDAVLPDAESPAWSFDLEPPARHAAPVERPAFVLERAEAVAVDLLILSAIAGIVAYFAARVAQVSPIALLSGAPYIGAFLVGVGLLYATCFTGATGQTPGKMLVGLRVVDIHGNPPGAARALLRSLMALLGLAFLGLGAVPIFLDPARRAAHDRLTGTRVIRP